MRAIGAASTASCHRGHGPLLQQSPVESAAFGRPLQSPARFVRIDVPCKTTTVSAAIETPLLVPGPTRWPNRSPC